MKDASEPEPLAVRAALRVLAERGMSCVAVDADLVVTDVCGWPFARGLDRLSVGDVLPEAVPELIGAEEVLAELLTGRVPRYELALVKRDGPDGEPLYLNFTVLPLAGAKGVPSGLLYVVEDVTATGRLLQRQEDLYNKMALDRREIDKLEDLRDLYVSTAAHELRSPMSSMMAYLELLAEGDYGDLTDDQRAAIEVLANSARRLIDTTDQLLDVTRLTEDRVNLLLQPAMLQELVRQTIREHQARADARDIRLSADIPPSTPLILCDEVRVAQILANLVGNAIKYTAEGGRVEVRAGGSAVESMVRVCVVDDGVGISAADQSKLFGRFYRADSARITGASGSGLGLYIAKALVELHSGEIGVESTPGEGSSFWFTLPTVTLGGR